MMDFLAYTEYDSVAVQAWLDVCIYKVRCIYCMTEKISSDMVNAPLNYSWKLFEFILKIGRFVSDKKEKVSLVTKLCNARQSVIYLPSNKHLTASICVSYYPEFFVND